MYVQTRQQETHSVAVYWNNPTDVKPVIPFTSIAQQRFAADTLILRWVKDAGQPWRLSEGSISGKMIKHNGHLSPYGRHVDLRPQEARDRLPADLRELIAKVGPKGWSE